MPSEEDDHQNLSLRPGIVLSPESDKDTRDFDAEATAPSRTGDPIGEAADLDQLPASSASQRRGSFRDPVIDSYRRESLRKVFDFDSHNDGGEGTCIRWLR